MSIKVENITKSFSNNNTGKLLVLDGIDFILNKNEMIALVGPSGCGKTTLLKIISGFIKPDSGKVILDSDNNIIPVVWQEHRLYPWLTVEDNIKFGLQILGHEQTDINKRINKYLDLINLNEFRKYFPANLSEGMKQRISIARALSIDSNFILMDEPFASVDYLTKIQLFEEIKEIQKKEKLGILYVTHDLRDAIRYADRIIVLSSLPARILKTLENTLKVNPSVITENEVLNILIKKI